MFSAISRFVKEKILGKLVHSYEQINVQHGDATCSDRFEIREKNGQGRLFLERTLQDKHDVQHFSSDYDSNDVDALRAVFDKSRELIPQGEVTDFGVILRRQDGGMQSAQRFYIERSGGSLYLFSREDSNLKVAVVGELESSEDTTITYYPFEEVEAIARVLADAQQRMPTSS